MNVQVNYIIHNIQNHLLTGIGDFTHGINEIWNLRLLVLKYLIKYTNKKIIIFHEDFQNLVDNIYNDEKIIVNNIEYYRDKFLLDRYTMRVYSSYTYLKLIKFIRKHKDRIIMYGIDSEGNKRDIKMYKFISKNIKKTNYNLFFAHNFHVDTRTPSWHGSNTTGYFLKKKFKDQYKIILSCGFKGTIRYEAYKNNIQKHTFIKPINIEEMKELKDEIYIEDFEGKIYETGWGWLLVDKNLIFLDKIY